MASRDGNAPRAQQNGSPRNGQEPHRDSTPAAAKPTTQHSILTVPAPIKRVFDRFPLVTYPANPLPQSSAPRRDKHTLFIYTTPSAAATGAPSFHPACLKWQTLLRIYAVPAATHPSSTHASPSTTLPFLLPASPNPAPAQPVPIAALPSWIRAHSTTPQRRPTDPLHEALLRPIRRAYLHALFLSAAPFARAARPLYADGATRAGVVRDALAWQMRAAAAEEVTGASGAAWPRVDVEGVYGEAEDAMRALGSLLGEGQFFGRLRRRDEKEEEGETREAEEAASIMDAAVFGYTHVILELLDDEWDEGEPAQRLVDALKSQRNLVEHRDSMLQRYYS